ERAPLGPFRTRRRTPDDETAVLGDVAAHAALGSKPREIILCDGAESLFLPSVDRDHEMAREAFHELSRTEIVETFVLERRRERAQTRLFLTHCHSSDHGRENQPGRRFVLMGVLRPGETRSADQAAIHAHRVRPVKGDWQLGRSMYRESVAERSEASVKATPCGRERLVGRQHPRQRPQVRAGSNTTANSTRSKRPT